MFFCRSSRYCSDISKMVGCPVIHVNGDYPEVREGGGGRIAINIRGLCTRNLVSMSAVCILNVQDVVRAASIAMDYRLKFEKDIVVDMICFRRW